ncbi:hypothetical protein CPHO_08255 [Corynebacterium phocae]|uniref:Uncharacterized protein n=1 Tax=Corynebacterium phocae TaxID=161895 RepID=A0A1L7D429_9CORY|nr:hypothetical protein [Corynebacterium phocae]APT92878.1 hypothetical protein CPHO_08255 [Corynebacterium phocae]KAA8723200.1 hypothetical protein F4V58_07760 [Corynebacterium phocae]
MQTKLNPAGWVRLIMYVLSALVGIATVVATTLGYDGVAAILGTVAGAGAAITGGTAVANLPKAPDHQPLGGLDVAAILPAVLAISQAVQQQQREQAAPAPAPAVDVAQLSGQELIEFLTSYGPGRHHKEE